jgi:hypothetical protein
VGVRLLLLSLHHHLSSYRAHLPGRANCRKAQDSGGVPIVIKCPNSRVKESCTMLALDLRASPAVNLGTSTGGGGLKGKCRPGRTESTKICGTGIGGDGKSHKKTPVAPESYRVWPENSPAGDLGFCTASALGVAQPLRGLHSQNQHQTLCPPPPSWSMGSYCLVQQPVVPSRDPDRGSPTPEFS